MNTKTNVQLTMIVSALLQVGFWVARARGLDVPEEVKMAINTVGLGGALFAMPETWLTRIKNRG